LSRQPSNFIFGYGSLISSASRAETEGRATLGVPVRLSAGLGYVRAWNDRSPTGFTALGLRKVGPGESGRTINGVLYAVDAHDMAEFDAREHGYARVHVPQAALQPVSWLAVPSHGQIWTYVPAERAHKHGLANLEADSAFPILQSYLDVVVTGGLEHGPDFAAEILETTEGWSRYWLNDRRSGRRPWVFEREWRNIDDLLAAHPSLEGHNMLHERRLPGHYAAMHAAAIGPSPTASHPVTDPA
jgi:hypothetical protein